MPLAQRFIPEQVKARAWQPPASLPPAFPDLQGLLKPSPEGWPGGAPALAGGELLG